jgi:aerobic-type carbon monoxide dehydrogenase small subunit (CoxS/CutS family)
MADEDKVPNQGSSEEAPVKISRRDFLVGAGAGVVVTGAAAAGYIAFQKPETVEVIKEVIKEVPVTITQEVPVPGEPAGPVLSGTLRPVALTINGREYALMVEPRWTINYLLREKLGLTGTKTGCSRQMCGMCTVLANGRPIYSCTTLVVDYEGQEILTIESLAQNGQLHPVQQAFIEYNAFQCAWCTPGFIMSTVALLKKNPNPSLDVIKHELSGNLCRCGTYREVFQAVQAAAKKMA